VAAGEQNVDIAAWLHGLGLQQYAQAFCDNAVDASVLPELTADDLKDLGVNLVGHRRKLLAAIAALRLDFPSARPPIGSTEPVRPGHRLRSRRAAGPVGVHRRKGKE
jgi:hypothetical protein